MRLLNAETITLEEFVGNVPPYAILSHTWGKDEITFQDMGTAIEKARLKKGYQKILQTCREALRNDIKYAWVDTCCIDKSSSAELSEAINSMFTWYRNAKVCYAFLEDVPPGSQIYDNFITSRWFTRGWTLQELLAPQSLIFYACDWSRIAPRSDIAAHIAAASEIDEGVLKDIESPSVDLGQLLRSISIAERMSWASMRRTTREEDIAYCLLGIFGVNMPLLYGEGKRAFRRLQEEIIKSSNDESMFAWGSKYPVPSTKTAPSDQRLKLTTGNVNSDALVSTVDDIKLEAARGIGIQDAYGIFAETPLAFRDCGDIVLCKAEDTPALPFSITNLGVHIELLTGWIWGGLEGEPEGYHALLQCRRKSEHNVLLAIPIQRAPFQSPNIWHRRADYVRPIYPHSSRSLSPRSIYLTADPEPQVSRVLKFWIRSVPKNFDLRGIQVSRTCTWDYKSKSLSLNSWDAPEVLQGMVKVPFILPFREGGSQQSIGIHLKVRAPYNLFHWPMPWWADCHFTSSIPAEGRASWLADPELQVDGPRYVMLHDSTLVHATVASETIRGARFFVVDIYAVPRGRGVSYFFFPISFFLSDWAKNDALSMIETAQSYFYYLSYRVMNIPSHPSSRTIWTWPALASALALGYSIYFSEGSTSRPAVHIFTFHAIDFTWNAIAAFWETRDNRLGKKVKVFPIVVQCGLYAVLLKLSFVEGQLVWYIVNVSNFLIALSVFERRDGLFHVAGLYYLSLILFHILQSFLERGSR